MLPKYIDIYRMMSCTSLNTTLVSPSATCAPASATCQATFPQGIPAARRQAGMLARSPTPPSFPPSLPQWVRWQLINANTDLHISPTSQANSRESTAACAREGFGDCNRISALHGHWPLAAALDHSKEHRYVSGGQCPRSCCHSAAD